MKTYEYLAQELRKIGLNEMADKAATGYYHDFLSPLDFPELQLSSDLAAVGTPEALALRRRHHAGEFDANEEESDEWAASPEGQETLERISPPGHPTPVNRCLGCSEKVDMASNPFGNMTRPKSGDVTVCMKCGHLMSFNDDLTLRELTDQEMIRVAGDKRLLAIQKARGEMEDGKNGNK